MDDEEKVITLFKVITLGDFASGKSTLIRRLINQKFEENTMSIIGFLTSTKDIVLKNGTKI